MGGLETQVGVHDEGLNASAVILEEAEGLYKPRPKQLLPFFYKYVLSTPLCVNAIYACYEP